MSHSNALGCRHRTALFLVVVGLLSLAAGACGVGVAARPSASNDSGGAAGSGGSSGHSGTWKIMPFGDSITASTCYRAKLWDELSRGGYTNVDFVGSRSGPAGCGVASYDMDDEGHGGYIARDILKAAGSGVRPGGADPNDPYFSDVRDLGTWFENVRPDIVLLHFGTNDVWNGVPNATILEAYSALLNKLRSRNPNVIVLVAQIIPMAPTGCTGCAAGVSALNAAIPGWASTNNTSISPITVVDQYTSFDVTWTRDGVHPNDTTGSQAMADKWYRSLKPLLK